MLETQAFPGEPKLLSGSDGITGTRYGYDYFDLDNDDDDDDDPE